MRPVIIAWGSESAVPTVVEAVRAGELVVLPTDTVYGVGADAFDPVAVQRLLDAKGRDRTMPPPVLVGDPSTIDALVVDVQPWLTAMLAELWPGALTVVCRAQPSLSWDLGETRGTVAVRVPAHEATRAVLRATGPLAVSSANLTGQPAAVTAAEAHEMLGDRVAVYLDAGPSGDPTPSTILDVTRAVPRVLRHGAVSLEQLHRFNNTIPAD